MRLCVTFQGSEASTDKKHVLTLLVKDENMDLLDHPVVIVAIKYLGSQARNTFLFSLLTYSVFLSFLTAGLFVMDPIICYGNNHSARYLRQF